MEKANLRLRQHMIEVVKNQIRDKDPPETEETFNRLRRQGHAEEEAYRLIGCVVSAEIHDIAKQKRLFDRELYVKRLRALPRMPWE